MPHLKPAAWTRVVIYTRLSRDEEGQTSTARQEMESRLVADRLGLPVAEVYAEAPGTSGWKDVARPEFDRMLRDLTPGTVVVAWALDRLSRRGMEQVGAVLRVVSERGARIVTVSDGVDTEADGAELTTGVRAILAAEESRKIAARVRSAKVHARLSGRWGGSRPFGYTITPDKRLALEPTEAAVLRECVRRVLDGASLRAVCSWLNAEGISAPRGGDWRVTALTKALTSPTLAGLQSTGGEVVRREDGTPVTVTEEPVVSVVERARLLATLEERGRAARVGRTPGASTAGRRPAYLLSGFLRCAECGGAMTADKRNGVYRCNGRVQGGTCPGVTVDLASTDEEVALAVTRRLAALDPEDPALDAVMARWMARQDPTTGAERAALVDAVEEARASLADLQEARFVRRQFEGQFLRAQYDKMHAGLSERLAAAEAALAAVPDTRPDVSTLLDTVLSREAWEVASLEDRRGLLSLVLDRVTVGKAATTGGRFDASRVSFAWAASPEAEDVEAVETVEGVASVA